MVLDSLKQFAPLPADIAPFQLAAHRRLQQLASQLQQSFKNAPVIPLTWRPADMDAEVPVFVPAPAPARVEADVALVDGRFVLSRAHLLTAAMNARHRHGVGKMKTRTLHSELIYCLSAG